MQNIMITGAGGQIGSRLAEKLPHAVLIDSKEGDNLLNCYLPPDIDVIYHLAAHSSVEDSWHDPVRYVENVQMTVRLATEYPHAKIIHANSAAHFETVSSPYAFFKHAAWRYLNIFHKKTVDLVFPNVYGGAKKSVVDIFKDKDEVTIYGDGLHKRDYVHVDDIVEGLILAKDWEAGQYQMGSGVGTSVLELAGTRRIKYEPARKEAEDSVLKNTTPNWKPKIGVMDYLNS